PTSANTTRTGSPPIGIPWSARSIRRSALSRSDCIQRSRRARAALSIDVTMIPLDDEVQKLAFGCEIPIVFYNRGVLEAWALDPDVVHLNHGSYGGCPLVVVAAAHVLRTRLEAAPMRFLVREWQPELDRARTALAAFVRAPDDRLV